MIKKTRDTGGKAWQRDDNIDRTIPYKDWINSKNSNGFWLDADAIKWRYENGVYKPIMITELTACEWETVATDTYLKSITNRIFKRDKQGIVLKTLGELLNVPVYWVVFPPSVSWIYAYHVGKDKWGLFNPADKWIEYISKI